MSIMDINDLRKRLRLPRVIIHLEAEENASKKGPAQFVEGKLQKERRL